MPVILSGGGGAEQVVPIDEAFAKLTDPGKPVLYLPVAMEPSVFSYDECFSWFKSTYNPYGISLVELCTQPARARLDESYAAVYVGGGNTFRLMHALRASRFDEQLVRFVRRGGVLYGGSAGAMACGHTIGPALHADRYTSPLVSLAGLDLLSGFDVWCHYHPDTDDDLIAAYPGNLYVLYEESGLIIDENGNLSKVGRPGTAKPT